MQKTLLDTQTTEVAQSTAMTAINLFGETGKRYTKGYSVQQVIEVTTPSATNFLAGESEVTTVTFPAKAGATAGDYFVVYDSAGLAWAASLDVAGTDPEPTGAIWTSIAAGRKVHVDISGATDAASVAALVETAFDALSSNPFVTDDSAANGTMTFTCTIRGNTTDAVVKNEDDSGAGSIAEAQTNQGVSSTVEVTDNEITMTAHGFKTGLKGQLTTTGTLPAGISLATDYFVIVVDTDTIKLATTLVNANVGTAVNITDQGTDGATHTFTPTSIAGCNVKYQGSNDNSNWIDLASATNITATVNLLTEKVDPTFNYVRGYFTMTAGQISVTQTTVLIGE